MRIRKILVALLCGIVILPLALVGMKILLSRYQVSAREVENIRVERNRLMNESRDPERRTVLTDEILKAEYRYYYANRALANGTVNAMTLGFAGLCIVICGVTFVASFLSYGFRWRKFLSCVIPIPFLLVAIFLLRSRMLQQLPPDPDDVVCRADLTEITRKYSKTTTHTDSDGHSDGTTTTYYICFKGRSGAVETISVTASEYEAAVEHDFCIIASAEGAGEVVYYEYYDAGKFVRGVE